jgi:hypothetical protein
LPESPQLARALARQSQIQMLKQRPESVERAREAIAVARRVGDSFAEVNARINVFTHLATTGVAPDPDDVVSIVEAAAEAGEYEEAYRAIVNFIWSATGYLAIDRIERVVSEGRGRLADVPPPLSIGPYLELSIAMLLLVPSARWTEADAVLAEVGEYEGATFRLVFLVVAGGLALRRGDLQTTKQFLEELRPLALSSGEPQRIIPMAGVVLPWLVVTDELDELRSLAEQILATVDRPWPNVLNALPVIRALAAAGETQLLLRTTESIRKTRDASGQMHTAPTAAEALLALLQGRPDEAAAQLELAAQRQRQLGHTYDAACLDLDLARALEAAGRTAAAQEVQTRAASVLEPLGCVNPF